MEVLPVLKPKGAIHDLDETPVILDLRSHRGGYVSLKSLSDDDRFYVCALPSTTDPTPFTATTTGETGHDSADVAYVADIARGGPDGASISVTRGNPYLWIRTVTGTITTHIKPKGRPGEGH